MVRAALGSDDVDAVKGSVGSEQPGEVGDDESGGDGADERADDRDPGVAPVGTTLALDREDGVGDAGAEVTSRVDGIPGGPPSEAPMETMSRATASGPMAVPEKTPVLRSTEAAAV